MVSAAEVLFSGLFHPAGLEAFLSHQWPDSVYEGELEGSAFRVIRDLPVGQSAASALAAHRGEIRVAARDERGQTEFLEGISTTEAAERYRDGGTVLLEVSAVSAPVLRSVSEQLERAAGVPQESCDALVHLSKPGTGFSVHFDDQDVLLVQIRGTKTWRIGRSPAIVNPTVNYVCGAPIVGELRSYWPDDLVADASFRPAEVDTIVMKPGSVLFVPRGYWHWTEAGNESIAASFGFHTPCWADVVASVLAARLPSVDPLWRESAWARWAPVGDSKRNRAGELIADLLSDKTAIYGQVRDARDVMKRFSPRLLVLLSRENRSANWAEHLARTLRQRLILDPAWRQPAFGGWGGSPGPHEAQALQVFSDLLAGLEARLDRIGPSELLAVADRFSTVDEWLTALTESFVPGQTGDRTTVYQFNLTGDGGRGFYLRVSDGQLGVEDGEHPSPDLTLQVDARLLLRAGRSWIASVRLFEEGHMVVEPMNLNLLGSLSRTFRFWLQ